ncbi:MAG TPA: ACT domain-containing protein [Syntrophomonadaceae bacterium]|nr:ACT domain-containing protein [Syntrophomonadaceae bacterium]
MPDEGTRVIITVLGYDQVGIIAAIASILADARINILDISQTILQGFFTMIMVVDMVESSLDTLQLSDILSSKGQEMNLSIMVQHEDIFKYMHRIG